MHSPIARWQRVALVGGWSDAGGGRRVGPVLGAADVGRLGRDHRMALAAAPDSIAATAQAGRRVAHRPARARDPACRSRSQPCRLSGSAIALGQRLTESKNGAEALKTLSSGDAAGFDFKQLDPEHVLNLLRQHGATALGAVRKIFGAASVALIGLVVFVAGFYTFLTEGKQAHDWLLERAPLSHAHFHRLANVFSEVGRGLVVGVGLTALSQGAVATIGYLVTGVPQAFVLGLVTVFASLDTERGFGAGLGSGDGGARAQRAPRRCAGDAC